MGTLNAKHLVQSKSLNAGYSFHYKQRKLIKLRETRPGSQQIAFSHLHASQGFYYSREFARYPWKYALLSWDTIFNMHRTHRHGLSSLGCGGSISIQASTIQRSQCMSRASLHLAAYHGSIIASLDPRSYTPNTHSQ